LRRFPPGGLARYCVDRLTMICIFRIWWKNNSGLCYLFRAPLHRAPCTV
jgi:hypothetical protein